jgi:hypothetical protein
VELTLDLPEPVALELFADDTAGVPATDRSNALYAVHAAVTVVGVAANLMTVVVSGGDLPEVARRLAAWVRGTAPSSNASATGRREVRITAPAGATTVVTVAGDGSMSVDVVVRALQAAAQDAPQVADAAGGEVSTVRQSVARDDT